MWHSTDGESLPSFHGAGGRENVTIHGTAGEGAEGGFLFVSTVASPISDYVLSSLTLLWIIWENNKR